MLIVGTTSYDIKITIAVDISQREAPHRRCPSAEIAPRCEVTRAVIQIDHALLIVVAGCDIEVAVTIHIPQRAGLGSIASAAKVMPGWEVTRLIIYVFNVTATTEKSITITGDDVEVA